MISKEELEELLRCESIIFNQSFNDINALEIYKIAMSIGPIIRSYPSDINCINFLNRLKPYILQMFNELSEIVNNTNTTQKYKEYSFVIFNRKYNNLLTLCFVINGKFYMRPSQNYINAKELLNLADESEYQSLINFIDHISTNMYQTKNAYKTFEEEKDKFFKLIKEIRIETDSNKKNQAKDELKVTIGNIGEYYALKEIDYDNSLKEMVHVAKDIGNDEHFDIYGVMTGEGLPVIIEVKATISQNKDFNNDAFPISIPEINQLHYYKCIKNIDCFIYRVFISYDENTKEMSFKTRILRVNKINELIDDLNNAVYTLATDKDNKIYYICGNENNINFTRVKYMFHNKEV